MSLCFAKSKALLLASLVVGLSFLAQAQSVHAPSTSPGQQILFSSPDGQIVSNAPLPAVEAPQPPRELVDAPDASPFSILSHQLPGDVLPPPMPVPIMASRERSSMENPMDERKRMGLLTPSEIMKVPTMEQIFGLPERNSAGTRTNIYSSQDLNSDQNQNQNTNAFSSSGDAFDSQAWQKMMDGRTGSAATNENAFSSGFQKNSPGILSAIFNGPPRDGLNRSQFGNDGDSAFGPSTDPQTGPQSQLDASLIGAMTPAPAPSSPPVTSPLDSPFNTQSPFEFPRSSSLPTTPQLPALPAAMGQNYTPPAPTPSWEPKPAPWLSPVPPLGTMAQRKF